MALHELRSTQRDPGLLNTDDQEFTASLIQLATEQFNQALAAGDKNRARLLLRFFAALVASNVLHASSVLAALLSIVEAATAIAAAGLHTQLVVSSRPGLLVPNT